MYEPKRCSTLALLLLCERSRAVQLPSVASASGSLPWLAPCLFEREHISELARDLHSLPLTSATLVKAFDPRNDAESFCVGTPLIRWVCQRDKCGCVYDPATTILEAATKAGAPISAKLAVTNEGYSATPSLRRWLSSLEEGIGRRSIDVDAYLTSASTCATTSASLGWHIDDVRAPCRYCAC